MPLYRVAIERRFSSKFGARRFPGRIDRAVRPAGYGDEKQGVLLRTRFALRQSLLPRLGGYPTGQIGIPILWRLSAEVGHTDAVTNSIGRNRPPALRGHGPGYLG
jgi:hypothetical protein